MSQITTVRLDSFNFVLYQKQLIQLYKNVFQDWINEQTLDDSKIAQKFQKHLSYNGSYFLLLLDSGKVIGYCGGFSAYAKYLSLRKKSHSKNRIQWEQLYTSLDFNKTFYIVGLGIDKTYQRKGHAKKLLEEVILYNREYFTLFLIKTFQDNISALNLYHKHFHFQTSLAYNNSVFLSLDKTIKKINFTELMSVVAEESGEELIEITEVDNTILLEQINFDRLNNNNSIKVRRNVGYKLKRINDKLKAGFGSRFCLNIVSAYQDVEHIAKRFEEYRQELSNQKVESKNLYDFIDQLHQCVGVPTISGYTTGGMLDITIYDNVLDNFLNMGCLVYEYSSHRSSWFAVGLNQEEKRNRQFLLDLMLSENFAPYWRCWWRFSYGDKEWARYYERKHAIYDQIQ